MIGRMTEAAFTEMLTVDEKGGEIILISSKYAFPYTKIEKR